jgi:hypothetical protein
MSAQNDDHRQTHDEYRYAIYVATVVAPLVLLFGAWFSPNPPTLYAWILWTAWIITLPFVGWMHYVECGVNGGAEDCGVNGGAEDCGVNGGAEDCGVNGGAVNWLRRPISLEREKEAEGVWWDGEEVSSAESRRRQDVMIAKGVWVWEKDM